VNPRFADYVTSGAFNMSLTRGQIADLSAMVEAGSNFVDRWSALERRGLIERIPSLSDWPGDFEKQEWRLTAAGALVVNLLFQAGLTNRGDSALARECDALRAQLAAANAAATEARKRLRSMHARYENLRLRIDQSAAVQEGDLIPIRITPRDPIPDASINDLIAGIVE